MVKPPDTIAVKYSEDLAQYADLRPVVRQPMTLHELVGLVLTTTGKHPERVRERLRRGSCTFNVYHYWWDALEVDDATLAAVLAEFPDPDPARPFRPEECAWARLHDDREPVPRAVLLAKQDARRRRWLRRQSFWDFLMEFARARRPRYREYSYYHRADIYCAALAPPERALLREESRRRAPRALRQRLVSGEAWVELELGCPRTTGRALEG